MAKMVLEGGEANFINYQDYEYLEMWYKEILNLEM